MATTAPVVDCADRAAARARQAATTPEICIAFPTMIERRPKILRLGDKSDPFMFAVNCRSRDYRKRISVSQRSIAVTTARSGTPLLKRQLVHVATRISPDPTILDEWSRTQKLSGNGVLGCWDGNEPASLGPIARYSWKCVGLHEFALEDLVLDELAAINAAVSTGRSLPVPEVSATRN